MVPVTTRILSKKTKKAAFQLLLVYILFAPMNLGFQ
jgi:hypothetical protein